jgi:hypothetical protein
MKAKVEAELFDGEMPVLEAIIKGTKHPSQEIILMAHLDHYKPGANDNASGSAGMIEIAKSILNMVSRGDIPPLKRTIRFLWLPELHGATAYLTDHLHLKNKGIAGLNLDMIGENYYLCESFFHLIQTPYSVPGYIDQILSNFLGWIDNISFFSPRGSRLHLNYRIRSYRGGSDHVVFNDSTLAIPTPMLGHGDVFHHTSLDSPEKCDPTELKRIISLATASVLLIANANDEDALKIAREVLSLAEVSMTERSRKSIDHLQQYANDEVKKQDISELYAYLLSYPRLQAEIEGANILEVAELCANESIKNLIKELAGSLKHKADFEREKIKRQYKFLLNHYNLKRKEYTPSETNKKASSLFPNRLFKGTLPWDFLVGNLSKQDYSWYSPYRKKYGQDMGTYTYEIANLMNGQRDILSIRHIVSCQFKEIDTEFVLHFVKDLKKLGLVAY